MDYLTRCHNCQAVWRYHEEARMAQPGAPLMVRCGSCDAMFDAHEQAVSVRSLSPDSYAAAVAHPPITATAFDANLAPAPKLAAISTWLDAPEQVLSLERLSQYLVLVLLSLTLLIHGLFTARGTLASHSNIAWSIGTGVCQVLGCAVVLPKRNANIGIEASDLEELNSQVLVLRTMIKNHGKTRIQYPYLRLYLKDQQNQAVAHRLLAPDDYVPASLLKKGMLPGQEYFSEFYIDNKQAHAVHYQVTLE